MRAFYPGIFTHVSDAGGLARFLHRAAGTLRGQRRGASGSTEQGRARCAMRMPAGSSGGSFQLFFARAPVSACVRPETSRRPVGRVEQGGSRKPRRTPDNRFDARTRSLSDAFGQFCRQACDGPPRAASHAGLTAAGHRQSCRHGVDRERKAGRRCPGLTAHSAQARRAHDAAPGQGSGTVSAVGRSPNRGAGRAHTRSPAVP